MNSTGLVRRIDDAGRLVIPKEIRKKHGLDKRVPVEFFTTDSGIVALRKYIPSKACAVTGSLSEDNMELSPGVWVNPELVLSRIQAKKEELLREEMRTHGEEDSL